MERRMFVFLLTAKLLTLIIDSCNAFCLVPSSYVSDWTSISSQADQRSEVTFLHGLGEIPLKVYTEVKAKIGGEDYIFQGYGSSHIDDDRKDPYGGVVFMYNDREIRVFAPNVNNQFNSGKAFYTGTSSQWMGTEHVTLDSVDVRVRAWKRDDLPTPAFESPWYPIDSSNASMTYQEISHDIGDYPDYTVVQVRGVQNYVTEGQGMSNVVEKSDVQSTLGVLYGYSHTSFRIWTPGITSDSSAAKDCGQTSKYDIVFVLDESGSVGEQNFNKTKEAITKVLVFLNIDTGDVRVGILCYASVSRVIFDLKDYPQNLTGALAAVDNIDYQRGGTKIASAMKNARENMFVTSQGDRGDADNIMVVMTDGLSNDQYSEMDEAAICKTQGIKIMSVGIGTSIDETMLRSVASTEMFYLKTDFESLQEDFENLMEALGPCPSGGVIGAYDGWGDNSRLASTTGEFKIYAWDFPESAKIYQESFHRDELMTMASTVQFGPNVIFSEDNVIVVTEVEPHGGANGAFRFQGLGSVMHEGADNTYYGGLVYGYNSNRLLYWLPSVPQYSAVLNLGSAWGHGVQAQKTDDVNVTITVWQLTPLASVRCPFEGSVVPSNFEITMSAPYSLSLDFECLEHHTYLSGDRSITCQKDCTWSGPPLRCQEFQCAHGDLLAQFSTVNVTSYTNGGTAVSRCDEGYTQVGGDSIRICQAPGQWTGKKIQCELDDTICRTSVIMQDVPSQTSYKCLPFNTVLSGDLNTTCSAERLNNENCSACFVPCPTLDGKFNSTLRRIHRKETELFKRSLISVDNHDRSSVILGYSIVAVPLTAVIFLCVSDFPRFRMDFRFGADRDN